MTDQQLPTPDSLPADAPSAGAPFDQLPLAPAVLANLRQLGYLNMTPIQAGQSADCAGGP